MCPGVAPVSPASALSVIRPCSSIAPVASSGLPGAPNLRTSTTSSAPPSASAGRRAGAGRVEHRYDRLILVAPPHFLGTLRQVLDAQVQACVVAELDKELVAERLDRLHARVQAHLGR